MRISFINVTDWPWFDVGLVQILTCLKNAGHEVNLIDPAFKYRKLPFILDKIREYQPDMIGFSAMSSTFKRSLRYAGAIKSEFGIKTIWGGIHPTLAAEEVIELAEADYVCVGEGERTIVEFLSRLENRESLDVKGIWYKENGRVIKNEKRELISDLDGLPLPDWDFWNVDEYLEKMAPFPYSLPIMQSRGCPNRCAYCSVKPLSQANSGGYFRTRTAESVMEEINMNRRKYPKLKAFNFRDCTFGLVPEHFEKLTGLLKKTDLKWKCQTRAELVDEEWAGRASEAGCIEVSMGFDIHHVKEYRRNQKFSYYRKATEALSKFGILFSLNVIIGGPDETIEEARLSLKKANQFKPHFRTVGVMTPFPRVDIAGMKKGKFRRTPYMTPTLKKYFTSDSIEKLLIKDDIMHFARLLFREFKRQGPDFFKWLGRGFFRVVRNTTRLDVMRDGRLGSIVISAVIESRMDE